MRRKTAMEHWLFIPLLIAFVCLPASAQEQQKPVFADNLKTIAGELKIIEVAQSCKYSVTLGGKIILKTDCDDESNKYASTPIPQIHTYYKSFLDTVRPFDEVILLQLHMVGNACNGGPLMFLGLKGSGSYSLSEEIDFCGGRQPVITWGSGKAIILIPGGPPNRGTGYIPPETWIYEKGLVRKMATTKRR